MSSFSSLERRYAAAVAAALLSAVQRKRDEVSIAALVRMIERHDVEAVVEYLGVRHRDLRELQDAMDEAFRAGGQHVQRVLPRLNDPATGEAIRFVFDPRNPRAERWSAQHGADMVTRIAEPQRQVIREAVTRGLEQGRNGRSIALDIAGRVVNGRRQGGVVGLTPQMERFAQNAREQLLSGDERLLRAYLTRERRDRRFDPVVRRAIRDGTAIPAAQVDAMVSRYEDRLLQLRAENIGRTEAHAALSSGRHEALQQAVDDGLLRDSQIIRIWDSTGDDGRTRDTHLEMDGQQRPMGEPFVSPSGVAMMYPGDSSLGADPDETMKETINCRCVERIAVDFLAGVR